MKGSALAAIDDVVESALGVRAFEYYRAVERRRRLDQAKLEILLRERKARLRAREHAKHAEKPPSLDDDLERMRVLKRKLDG